MKNTCIALGFTAIAAQAAVVNLTPADINGGDTNTASYSDGNVTLTPLIGTTPATFNDNAVRLGIDGTGTNVNAFNDPDTDPNNGNEERLEFDFSLTVGLSSIVYDFSRADGPGSDDGVIISGFTSDPTITFSPAVTNLSYVWNALSGSVRINVPGSGFSGTDIAINFDPNASLGQTLLMTVTDTTQAGAQLAVTGISYDVVPEPSIALLGGLGLLGLIRRRR